MRIVFALILVVGCRSTHDTTAPVASASAVIASPPPRPWIDQARDVWKTERSVVDLVKNDAGSQGVGRVHATYDRPPDPEQLSKEILQTVAIEAPDRPCSLTFLGKDVLDAGAEATFYIGHVNPETTAAWLTAQPRDIVKLIPEGSKNGVDFKCSDPSWLLITPRYMHKWNAWARDYHGVWDGSKVDPLTAEKMCQEAADLDLFKGETFPDPLEATDLRLPSMSSQSIRWRGYSEFKSDKEWFACAVDVNEEPIITWDKRRD